MVTGNQHGAIAIHGYGTRCHVNRRTICRFTGSCVIGECYLSAIAASRERGGRTTRAVHGSTMACACFASCGITAEDDIALVVIQMCSGTCSQVNGTAIQRLATDSRYTVGGEYHITLVFSYLQVALSHIRHATIDIADGGERDVVEQDTHSILVTPVSIDSDVIIRY